MSISIKPALITLAVTACFSTGALATINGVVTVDGAESNYEVINGQIIFGSSQAQETTIVNPSNYGLLVGHNNNGSATSEDAKVLGQSIRIEGVKENGQGAVWVHGGNGVKAHLVIGDQNTKYVTVQNNGNWSSGISALGYGEGHLEINASEQLTINALGSKGTGIHAQRNTETETPPEDRSSIVINANKTVVNAGYIGVSNFSNGKIEINGNLEINAPIAFEVRGHSDTIVNKDGNADVVINGDIYFGTAPGSGNFLDANLDIHLTTTNSHWVGNLLDTYPVGHEQNAEWLKITGMKLELANGAQWTPTIQNELGDVDPNQPSNYRNINFLTLNGGQINLTQDLIGSSTETIVIEHLQGTGGTINLATNLDAESERQTSKIVIEESSEDVALDVKLKNSDMSADLTSDDITPEVAKDLMSNISAEQAQVSTNVTEGLVNSGFGVDAEGNTHHASANTLMQSSLEMASAAPLALNRIMMNDVRKRLGDIRTTQSTHGAWARYDGGKLSGEGGLENDFHTVQVGIDTVPTADAPRFGVAFSYTDSDADYARGSADMKAYSLAMYGTKVFDNGMFVDVIGRMGTADTDMVVDGQHKGSMDNVVLGLSGELGWRFDVTDSIYVEPQAEVTYTYVNSDNLTLSTAKYDVDSVNSLLGRVGFAAGMKCPSNYGNVYVRASAVHEFLGDSKITGTNAGHTNVYEIDGKDTWFEYGIGANFNVTKSTYVWADVERTTGGALDEDWRATVGVRYAW